MREISKLSLVVLLLGAIGFSLPTHAQTEAPLFASMQKARELKVGLGSAPPYIAISPDGNATGTSSRC